MRQTSEAIELAGPGGVTKLPSGHLNPCSGSGPAPDTHRSLLERWVRAPTTPQRVVRRSRIVLLMMSGRSIDETAAQLGVSRPTVKLWTTRFAAGGPDALLHDAPGRGRHSILDAAGLHDTLREAHLLDADGQPASLRRAAGQLRVSTTTLWRALHRWRALHKEARES